MKTVNFTEMKNGTKDEYLLLDEYEQKYIDGTADRILKFMSGLNSTLEGYKITRLEHSLQTATRAFKDNADEEMVVAALLHDIGDELAPVNHSEYAASVLKPYVSEKTHWIPEHPRAGPHLLPRRQDPDSRGSQGCKEGTHSCRSRRTNHRRRPGRDRKIQSPRTSRWRNNPGPLHR